MAVLAPMSLTYADLVKRTQDGKIAYIVETLNETNEVLSDMRVMECNQGTAHKSTQRASLPSGAFRAVGEGAPKGKSQTIQITDNTSMYEAWSDVDEALVDISPDKGAFLASESRSFIAGMNNGMALNLFYGNSASNPKGFDGLFTRYNKIAGVDTLTAGQIVDAGGTGSANTSVGLCVWGDDSVLGIFPKGTQGGLKHEDLGRRPVKDAGGINEFMAYSSHYKWYNGLCVRDKRQFVRIANIDQTVIMADSTKAKLKDLLTYMIMAQERIYNLRGGNVAYYCNRSVMTLLRLAILEKIAFNLTEETVGGKPVVQFNGIPVRRVDEIISTEARVV